MRPCRMAFDTTALVGLLTPSCCCSRPTRHQSRCMIRGMMAIDLAMPGMRIGMTLVVGVAVLVVRAFLHGEVRQSLSSAFVRPRALLWLLEGQTLAEAVDRILPALRGRRASPEKWWQGRESNSRPRAYESPALPLSYPAEQMLRMMRRGRFRMRRWRIVKRKPASSGAGHSSSMRSSRW